MNAIKLRPHHILDIVAAIGREENFEPHPYGHAVHTVAAAILADPDMQVELVAANDDICRPCKHLGADGLCNDFLRQLDPPIPKQKYNDNLDTNLAKFLGLKLPLHLTIRQFLVIISKHMPDVAQICSHPGEDRTARYNSLKIGLAKFGVKHSWR